MAKKWKPSLKQLSAYDELLKRQNETRRQLLKRRRKYEEEGSGRTLPDLVIPMKARRHSDMTRYRFDSYKDYREKMRLLSELYGGKGSSVQQYYKVAYKQNILNIIKDWIKVELNFEEKPNGLFGKYSDEQIKIANQVAIEGGRFLELYNRLVTLHIGEFMDMYDSGMIPSLTVIYEEMQGLKLSKVDEFIDSFSEYRRQVREKNPNRMVKQFAGRPDQIDDYSEIIENRSLEDLSKLQKEAKRIRRK